MATFWIAEAVMAQVCHVLTLVNGRVAYALITIDLMKGCFPMTTTVTSVNRFVCAMPQLQPPCRLREPKRLAIVDGDQCCGPASAVDPAVSSCCGGT